MLDRSASLTMSTSILKALPGKLEIKRHSPNILYLLFVVIASITRGRILFLFCDMVAGVISSLSNHLDEVET